MGRVLSTCVLLVAACAVAGTARCSRAADAPEAQAWAIVIGIERYEDPAIPGSPGAVGDAREIRQWLVEKAGWSPRNVLLLQDSGLAEPGSGRDQAADLKPTRRNLEWAATRWLGSRVQPGDLVLIYYAGQAIGVASTEPGAASPQARELLLPIDARSDQIRTTGWALDETLDNLGSRGQNPVVCWLDTSLQGRGSRVPAIAGAATAASGFHWISKLARWPGVSVWLAADGHSTAEPSQASGRGVVADRLIKGLGTPAHPSNLLACLDSLNHDPLLQRQGFTAVGGLGPEISLWSQAVRSRAPSSRTLLLQRGHADRVPALEFTADGSRMVSASWDSTVKIWRVGDRALLRTLPEYFHIEGVTALALSGDGRWLASGDGAGRVRVWDVVESKETRLTGPSPHARRVETLAFLPDGTHLVSADQDGLAWLWDVSGPELRGKRLADGLSAVATSRLAVGAAIAVASERAPIRLFGADGRPEKTLPAGGAVVRLALTADGRVLATGDDEGRVTAWDVPSGKPRFQHAYDSEISLLAFSPDGRLAVGTEDAVFVTSLGHEGAGQRLETAGAARQAVFSADGQWLATCARRSGRVQLWRLRDPGGLQPVALADTERASPPATSVAFAPASRMLVSGDQDGGLRCWSLPEGTRLAGVPPRRGKVCGLSVSDDGRYLLQITRDWSALVWDLKEGRGFLAIEGRWTSGAITPDGSSLVLSSGESGEVFIVDRHTGRPRGKALPRPAAQTGKGTVAWRFGAGNVADGAQMVVVSRDGRWAAACSSEGPIACVWNLLTGELSATIRDPDHRQPISAVDLSAEGRFLLTADVAGTARLWDLAAGKAPRALSTFPMPDEPIVAARMSPADPRTMVTGTRLGRVLLWQAGRDRPTATLARLEGTVRALAFTPEGRWLSVAGTDKSVRLVSMEQPHTQVRLDRDHPHAEQVNALCAWPGGKVVVSASDDTTIRFWTLREPTLLGTLSATQEPLRAGQEAESMWVAYTPEGLFDSSPGGERQVAWLMNDQVAPLEQFYESSHVFGLCDWLRQGQKPPTPTVPPQPPPRLAIELKPTSPGASPTRTHTIVCSLSEPGLKNLRLYQNGVPVLTDEDLTLAAHELQRLATVTLKQGMNRFYLMASKPGSVDGRSNEIEMAYTGPESPPQLHILALGISHYRARALQFAHVDAQQIADFLHQHGAHGTGRAGYCAVLTDEEVTTANVEQELRKLQRRVQGRPQDTVVIFLAGHAEVRQNRFCLLLSSFRFPENAPAVVASRGAGSGSKPRAEEDSDSVLEYVRVYRNLARLGALQRLVIIDACQSEAVLDDPGVRLVNRYIEDGAQRSRTSYILAARRGETANEAAALGHGLLSYALLKGMGDTRLQPAPQLRVFQSEPNADRDSDGIVTTTELRQFADRTLPELAAQFPEIRERTGTRPASHPARQASAASQPLRVQTASTRSFPLVELPSGAR